MAGNNQFNSRAPDDTPLVTKQSHSSGPYHGFSAIIDPNLRDPRPDSVNATPSSRTQASIQSSPRRQGSFRNLQSSPQAPAPQVAGSSLGRAAHSMSPPLVTTPRSRQLSVDVQTPFEQRQLPSRDLTDESIDDAYVKFILYANPAVPHTVDTTDLRKTFRNPPRSDGKLFNIFTLWELIRKLENKELKTWTQLAIELGVEPPSAEKNQSAQKVQQYAVRLKRWMHAMHVDAFFEYLLCKSHPYYSHLPVSMSNSPDQTRDGVPLEEDLALRALVPEWKPKRGRRKAEDRDGHHVKDHHPPKRPHLDTTAASVEYDGLGGHSALFPQSAIPWSAFPDDGESHDPWAIASAVTAGPNGQTPAVTPHPFAGRSSSDFRWRMAARDGSPAAPYPQSAVTPRHRALESTSQAEPQSAVTPSSAGGRTRSRRRHGPAVSSAWPSNANASNGKLRGRPPTNRSTQDGPFSTFPANPKASETPSSAFPKAIEPPSLTLQPSASPPPGPNEPPPDSTAKGSLLPAWQGPGFQKPVARPSKLQLQVPQHSGGPVRLATPPTVLVNGETNRTPSPPFGGHGRRTSADFFRDVEEEDGENASIVKGDWRSLLQIDFNLDDIVRAFASRLLQSKLVGRTEPLTVDEVNAIAGKTLAKFQLFKAGFSTNTAHLLNCALTLGVNREVGLGGVNPSSITITVTPRPSNGTPRSCRPVANAAPQEVEYSLSIDTGDITSISSTVQIRNIVLPSHLSQDFSDSDLVSLRTHLQHKTKHVIDSDGEDYDLDDTPEMSAAAWKERFLSLRSELKLKEREYRRNRRKILEAVFAADV